MNFRYHPVFSPLPSSNPFPFRPSANSSRHPLNSPLLPSRLSRKFRTSPILAPNPCIIRTYKISSRNSFRIRTYAPPSDLRILKDLPSSNFSRNPFIFCTYKPPRICGKQTTYNPFIIRTYKIPARNSFTIRTYKNPRGPSLPHYVITSLRRLFGLSPVFSFSCALFCTSQNTFPRLFNRFRTLSSKHPGWVSPVRSRSYLITSLLHCFVPAAHLRAEPSPHAGSPIRICSPALFPGSDSVVRLSCSGFS